uniref:Uncharacterized protein n=1 Tax=viral metagenome TaxID=1070528 RepID=A0A6M3K0Q6_9ZZZZ
MIGSDIIVKCEDAVLMGLSALVFHETVILLIHNQDRQTKGPPTMNPDEIISFGRAAEQLRIELARRGGKPE